MSLSLKLLLFLILSTMLLIVVSGLLVYKDIRMTIEDRIKIDHAAQTRQTLFSIDQSLFERQNDVLAIASSSEIKNLLQNDTDTEKYNSLLKSSIQEFSITNGFWDALTIVDIQTNREVAVGNTVHVDLLEETEEYQRLLSQTLSGEVVYSDAIFSQGTRQFMFFVPIRSSEDSRQVLGAVVGYLSWPVIEEALNHIDNNQVILLNKNKEIIAKNKGTKYATLTVKESEIFDKIVQGESTHIIEDKENRESFLLTGIAEEGYLQYIGNSWILMIKTPYTVALGPAQSAATRIVVTLTAVSIGVFFILLFVINRSVINPIKKLTSSVSNISSGNFSERISIHSKDEFGILAKSFNTMAEKLSFMYKNLEDQVVNRTKDLSDAKIQLEEQLLELERMNKLMIGRELKMSDLKKEIEELKKKLQ